MATNPIQPLKRELRDLTDVVENNSLNGLRTNQEYIARALTVLYRRLQDLRATEQLLVQWIRRDTTIAEVQEKYNADHFKKINPVQAYAYTYNSMPDPHEYTVYVTNKLETMPGIDELLREQEKVRANILYVQSQITQLENRKAEIDPLIDGRTIKQSDIVQDKISKIMTSEIFFLYEIHLAYRNNSVNSKGERAYTQDPKIIRLLDALQNKFIAFAERNDWVVSGKIVLDLEDPGSDENAAVFLELSKKIRLTGTNNRLYNRVQKYSEEMRRNLNDPTIGKNLSSLFERVDEPGIFDSQAISTQTLQNFWDLTNESLNWWSTNALATAGEAAERAFNKVINLLHGDKPFCTPLSESQEEAARNADQMAKDQADEAGLEEQQRRLQRAEEEATSPLQQQLNGLLGQNDILDGFIKGNPEATSGTITDINDIAYGIGIATYSYNEKIYNDSQNIITQFKNMAAGNIPSGFESSYNVAKSTVEGIDNRIQSAKDTALQIALNNLNITSNYTIVSQGTVTVDRRNNIISGMAYTVIN